MDKSVAEIAALVGGRVVGDTAARITGVNGIKEASAGDLVFVDSPRYFPLAAETGATAILTSREDLETSAQALIVVRDPRQTFAMMLQQVDQEQTHHPAPGIHATAVIGEGVQLGADVAIGPHVVIENECELGDGVIIYAGSYVGRESRIGPETILYPNVVIRERVTVGARCILHPGVVLGADGFGFVPLGGGIFKVPQVGVVEIGDDVEIGANSTVDRATFGRTVIGNGTKIDNLVQIGHNVTIGEHCVISGMAGVAGSAAIGNKVTIGGQSGIAGHLDIGDGVTVGGRSGITKSIEAGRVVSGFPATDHNADLRIQAAVRRLPEAVRRLKQLEERIRQVEKELNGEAADDS